MALIICPECGGIVSDTVDICPHCGFLIKNSESEAAEHVLEEEKNICSIQNETEVIQDKNSEDKSSDDMTMETVLTSATKKTRKWPIIVIPIVVLVIIAICGYLFRGFLAKSITLENVDSQYYEIGDTFRLEYSVTPSFAADGVVWASSDEKIAVVDENGIVTTLSNGECEISVTTKNGKVSSKSFTVADIVGEWKCHSVFDAIEGKQYDAYILQKTSIGEPTFTVNGKRCEIVFSDSVFNGTWSYHDENDDRTLYKIDTDDFTWIALVTDDGDTVILTPDAESMYIFFVRK